MQGAPEAINLLSITEHHDGCHRGEGERFGKSVNRTSQAVTHSQPSN